MPAPTKDQLLHVDHEERIQWLEYNFDRLHFGRLGDSIDNHDLPEFGPPVAGDDIVVTYPTTVSRAGKGILLFSGSGSVLVEYAFTSAGIAAAIAAQVSGDIIELPAGTLTADFTIPDGGTVKGMSRDASIVAGKITLGSGSRIENLTVLRTSADAAALIGVTIGASGTGTIFNTKVSVQNTVGPAYAVYMSMGGNISCRNVELLAQVGTSGYAAYVASGTFIHYSGRAVGTTATYPYYL
jgi:hypothetical protein